MNKPLADAIERLRAFAREHLHGGCKILSQGNACTCYLCDVDRLAAAARAQEQDCKDAERYRWLRESVSGKRRWEIRWWHEDSKQWLYCDDKYLDSRIDAAIHRCRITYQCAT